MSLAKRLALLLIVVHVVDAAHRSAASPQPVNGDSVVDLGARLQSTTSTLVLSLCSPPPAQSDSDANRERALWLVTMRALAWPRLGLALVFRGWIRIPRNATDHLSSIQLPDFGTGVSAPSGLVKAKL